MKYMDQVSWSFIIFACLTLGLAPYYPPHIYEKSILFARGELSRAIDWFDLVLHALPWVVLIVKSIHEIKKH
ncbi:MAG: RND transporter [Chrysiogenales bacterium]|nr:MAG: RND transporter [Chrysiogenales bacterium]